MEIEKTEITNWLKQLQSKIVTALEQADSSGKFTHEEWLREEGGGGITRILNNGTVIEKGGVNFSAVHGKAPDFLFREKEHAAVVANEGAPEFFATGVSIVIHPQSPMVPIIHMNIRYFEMTDGSRWFGGGIDLTPHYIKKEDAVFFHAELKKICDKHDTTYYPKFKQWADDYFFIKHRNETRGIGGIFFDRLNSGNANELRKIWSFWQDVGLAFAPIYTELIHRNKTKTYNQKHKQWQLLRRGRYVEFNLVYDKGTRFGLETGGRIESILMSLPSLASWEYNYTTEAGTDEAETLDLLRKGVNWV